MKAINMPIRTLEARLEVLYDLKDVERDKKVRDQINDDIIVMQEEYKELTGDYYEYGVR